MRAERDNPTIKRLHKVKPHSLLVYVRGEAEPRKVPITAARTRWLRVGNLLDGIAWERIECMDKDGGLVEVITPEETDDEEMVPDRVDDVRDLVGIMREVQRDSMRETRMMFEASMRAQADLTASVVESLNAVRAGYELALKMQATALMQGAGGPEEPGGMEKMLQMFMMMGGMGGVRPPTAPARPVAVPAGPRPAAKVGG